MKESTHTPEPRAVDGLVYRNVSASSQGQSCGSASEYDEPKRMLV